MKLKTNKFEIKGEKGEVTSIKFLGIELLHNGQQGWSKTFPIIFPVVATSIGFEVNGINHKIPRHGFWKDLDWDILEEDGSMVFLAHHIENTMYPNSIALEMRVTPKNNQVNIETNISNLSKDDAYFHFGYHPAFVIDDKSKISINSKKQPLAIALDGRLTDKHISINQPLESMNFGKDYDTLVYKKDVDKVKLNVGNLLLTLTFNSPNMQIWKPENDKFVCIEPWWGWNDAEYKAPIQAEKKRDIIKLPSGRTFKATMNLKIN